MSELTAKEEAFAQAYVLGGCSDATAAWRKAHPLSKAKDSTQYTKASLMLKKEEVKKRIRQLQKKASEKAEKQFGMSIERRLELLDEAAHAGLSKYFDQGGNERRENIPATIAAVKLLNDMLGISLPGERGQRKSFNVNLRIQDASAEPEDD